MSRIIAFLSITLISGCGSGSIALESATSSEASASSNHPTSIGSLSLSDLGISPARIALTLIDPESNPTTLVLEFEHPVGATRRPLTLVGNQRLSNLETAPEGSEHILLWDFEHDLDSSAQTDAIVVAMLPNSGSVSEQLGAFGNDPPQIVVQAPLADESSGNIDVTFTVSDSSQDLVNVSIQYDIVGDNPDVGWKLARGANTAGTSPTPEVAFAGIATSESGSNYNFRWETSFDAENPLPDEEDQLVGARAEVVVRMTAVDIYQAQHVGFSEMFIIDNNSDPIAILDAFAIDLIDDERWGVRIPVRLIEENEGMVDAIFQWRRTGETFPELVRNELDAALVDPARRRELQICTLYPHVVSGLVVPGDTLTVRLPELAESGSWALHHGIIGRTLELMRSPLFPQLLTDGWSQNPLASPRMAVPIGDGLRAVVLDAPGGVGRLQVMELVTGAVERELAVLSTMTEGCMALEQGASAVLVATSVGSNWRIDRVDFESGASTLLASSTGEWMGPVRGIASLGKAAAVFTVDSELVRIDYPELDAVRCTSVVGDLAHPWGVAVDPLHPSRVYVSERDGVVERARGRLSGLWPGAPGRLVAVDIKTHLVSTIGGLPPENSGLHSPQSLVLVRGGSRLLVVMRTEDSKQQIVGLDLGVSAESATFLVGAAVDGEVGVLAAGPDGLILAARKETGDILASGGLEQRRLIDAYNLQTQAAGVTELFAPLPRLGQRWRMHVSGVPANEDGTDSWFLWDSFDVGGGGSVFLKATPFDSVELGVASESVVAISVRPPLDVAAVQIGTAQTTAGPECVISVDVDGDGDLDIVTANAEGDNLSVFLQTQQGQFASSPLQLGGPLTMDNPTSVVAADLDLNGHLDLVSANAGSDNLTIFFQNLPDGFEFTPVVVGDSSTAGAPNDVVAADIDSDGAPDLVSANANSSNLSVFFQAPRGIFGGLEPLSLGGPSVTDEPMSVAVADLDGNGYLDIVSGNRAGNNLTVFFQTSEGSFPLNPLELGNASITGGVSSVVIEDMDGDGDLDLISANRQTNNVTIFVQEDPGYFNPLPRQLGGPLLTNGPSYVIAADVDGNGALDLLSANRDGNNVTVFFQMAGGEFDSVPLVLEGDESSSVVCVDLDADGLLDVISTNLGDDNLSVFFQLSARPVDMGSTLVAASGAYSGPATADFDGDGDVDLVSCNGSQDNLSVHFQDDEGEFESESIVLGGPGITDNPLYVAAADLNGDGYPDVVSANFDGNDISVFFQVAAGVFNPVPLVLGYSLLTQGASYLDIADINQDGALDIISANVGHSTLTVFFQADPPGTFDRVPLELGNGSITEGLFAVEAGDMDGDGDLDLVTANYVNDTVSVFFQVGLGNFDPTPLVLASKVDYPISLGVADLDEDGDLDFSVCGLFSSGIAIFFQTSPGEFDPEALVLSHEMLQYPRHLIAADLDGDGDNDLVSANQGSRNLAIFLQVAPGEFATTPLLLGARSFSGVAASDIDGDGDCDLVGVGGALQLFWGGR